MAKQRTRSKSRKRRAQQRPPRARTAKAALARRADVRKKRQGSARLRKRLAA